jgi:hypothetical protein
VRVVERVGWKWKGGGGPARSPSVVDLTMDDDEEGEEVEQGPSALVQE